jgi:tetratricopeptide (TPR) repeat protein
MHNELTKFLALFMLLAIAAVLPAVAQNSSPQTSMDEANAFFQAKDWSNAAKAFEAITKKEPANFQVWNQLGTALLSLGKYDRAAAAYEKAVAINSNPITQYNLACAYARLNDKDKAFALLNKIASTGYFQSEQINSDADLASLHNDLRFKELLSQAQKAVRPCMASPEYRQFDFWIGEWEVQVNGSGQPAGQSSVQLILGDCVIFENWSGARGMNGKSFNIYNATRRQWQQTWVNDRGTITEFVGEFKNDRMEFFTEQVGADGKKQIRRMTLFNLAPSRVRQFSEMSTDEGKTWSVQYDLLYLRKK